MSPYLIACLASLALGIVIVVASCAPLLVRALSLRRRARAIAAHPTIVAAGRMQAVAERLRTVAPRLERIRECSARIGQATGELLASSALLRLQVDRISFATRLLLTTLVPTLRGCMADQVAPNA